MIVVGLLILISFGVLIYKSIPPMDPELTAPINEYIDWESAGIDYSNLDARKEYLDKLYNKVKIDYEINKGNLLRKVSLLDQ